MADLKPMKRGRKRKFHYRLRLTIGALSLAAAFSLQLFGTRHREVVEAYYSRMLYPIIARTLSRLNSVVSLSLAEVLSLLLVLGGIGYLYAQVYQIRTGQMKRGEFPKRLATNLFLVTGLGILCFLLIWGLNYSRVPIDSSLELKAVELNTALLEKVTRHVIEQTNSSYERAQGYEYGRASAAIERSYARMGGVIPAGHFAPPKPVFMSNILNYLGISGIYIPFTGEPSFNAAQPPAALPFTMAHEKAHQRGFALEGEANFLAFISCINSDDPYTKYSGYLLASSYLLSELATVDPKRYNQTRQMLREGPREDLQRIDNFWRRYRGFWSRVSTKVNDTYLRANRVESGVGDYNEVVQLIASYYLKKEIKARKIESRPLERWSS